MLQQESEMNVKSMSFAKSLLRYLVVDNNRESPSLTRESSNVIILSYPNCCYFVISFDDEEESYLEMMDLRKELKDGRYIILSSPEFETIKQEVSTVINLLPQRSNPEDYY